MEYKRMTYDFMAFPLFLGILTEWAELEADGAISHPVMQTLDHTWLLLKV